MFVTRKECSELYWYTVPILENKAAGPNLFGTRDEFCGRQFFTTFFLDFWGTENLLLIYRSLNWKDLPVNLIPVNITQWSLFTTWLYWNDEILDFKMSIFWTWERCELCLHLSHIVFPKLATKISPLLICSLLCIYGLPSSKHVVYFPSAWTGLMACVNRYQTLKLFKSWATYTIEK